jgi:hypothetical protein
MADIVNLQTLLGEKGRIRISHLAFEMKTRKSLWAAMREGSVLTMDEWRDLSRHANNDGIVTDITR